jgi:HAD superfamily hydrolase (TIGR01490 family)
VQISVFDLDHTLVNFNISYRFFLRLIHRRKVSVFSAFPCLWQFLWNQFLARPPQLFHQWVFHRFLKKMPVNELKQIAQGYAKEMIKKHPYQPTLQCLKKAKKENHYILLLSQSPDFLVETIAKVLKIEDVHASRYTVEKNMFVSIKKIMDGYEKANCLLQKAKQLKVLKKDIFIYTDSIWDLPMVEHAGNVIAVNPDRKLKKLAQQLGWKIL